MDRVKVVQRIVINDLKKKVNNSSSYMRMRMTHTGRQEPLLIDFSIFQRRIAPRKFYKKIEIASRYVSGIRIGCIFKKLE